MHGRGGPRSQPPLDAATLMYDSLKDLLRDEKGVIPNPFGCEALLRERFVDDPAMLALHLNNLRQLIRHEPNFFKRRA